MTSFGLPEPARRDRRRRPRRRGQVVRWAVRLVLLGLVFAVGIAFGEALHDNPSPGGSRTRIRTIQPLTVGPPRETVTVTAP